ncbi:MAG: hypothetical protein KBH93_07940, partial [Anaerolineae bacterium]|nr:hypothetical protein [Anaerolineae bacterium]
HSPCLFSPNASAVPGLVALWSTAPFLPGTALRRARSHRRTGPCRARSCNLSRTRTRAGGGAGGWVRAALCW